MRNKYPQVPTINDRPAGEALMELSLTRSPELVDATRLVCNLAEKRAGYAASINRNRAATYALAQAFNPEHYEHDTARLLAGRLKAGDENGAHMLLCLYLQQLQERPPADFWDYTFRLLHLSLEARFSLDHPELIQQHFSEKFQQLLNTSSSA